MKIIILERSNVIIEQYTIDRDTLIETTILLYYMYFCILFCLLQVQVSIVIEA